MLRVGDKAFNLWIVGDIQDLSHNMEFTNPQRAFLSVFVLQVTTEVR